MNPTDAAAAWQFQGATSTMIDPATIEINAENIFFECSLAGTDGLHGIAHTDNSLALKASNLFTGTISMTGGRLLPRFDRSLGVEPLALQTDAVVLNNATLGNYDIDVDIHPNRGITINNHAALHGRNNDGYLRINSPISGNGDLTILQQSSFVEFTNPGNCYTGDTLFGGKYYGWYESTSASAHLILGASEVIPDTSRLIFLNGYNGIIDLNDYTETVAGIITTNSTFTLNGSGGRLRTSANALQPFNALINDGATLEITAGTLHFSHPAALANNDTIGTLALSGGTLILTDPSHLGPLSLELDGGTLALAARSPGLAESMSKTTFNPNATDFVFNGIYTVPRWANGGDAFTGRFGNNTQYRYEGEWYVPTDANYSFAKGFDDGAILVIDDQTIISNNLHSDVIVVKDIYLTQGWHQIRLYVSNGSGGVGPREVDGFISGIIYDPTNSDIVDANNKVITGYAFADPGDGSVLRTPISNSPATARLVLLQDTTLECAAAPLVPLTWQADITSPADATLSIANSQQPIALGSPLTPALISATISSDSGVILQDKLWLKTLPANASVAPGADLTAGTPGVLGTGATTLNQYSLRIPAPNALGDPLDAPITVNTGYTLTFDATREYEDQLFDDPAYTFTAANAVTLAGGSLDFDGAGVVTHTAPITGNGNLNKLGTGTAILSGINTFTGAINIYAGELIVTDEKQLGNSNNTITITDGKLTFLADVTLNTDLNINGAINIPEGRTLTLNGTHTGSLTKEGSGTLILNNSSPLLDLHLTDGNIRLASTTGPAIRNLLGVDSGATLTLDGSGQIDGTLLLSGGTLDLNGHSYEFSSFKCNAPSTISNSSPTPTTLTIGNNSNDNFIWASVDPSITLKKKGASTLSLSGTVGGTTPSAIQVDQGTLSLGQQAVYVRLTLRKTRVDNRKPRLGEFMLTLDGYPLPYPNNIGTYASSSQQPHVSLNSIDGTTSSFWLSNEVEGSMVTVDLKQPLLFNGYALYSGTNITDLASSANDPTSWTVEISSDNTNWLLVDTVDDAPLYSNNPGVKIFERTLGNNDWPAQPSYSGTAISIAANATLVGAAPALALGSLSGSGTLELTRGSVSSVADLSDFSGTVSGGGALAISGATPIRVPSSSITPAYDARITSGNRLFVPPDTPALSTLTTPANAIIGANNTDASFVASLLQGTATLGLTKTGTSRLSLASSSSHYTGTTTIDSGTLLVTGSTREFRYIKFDVTAAQNDGVDGNGFELAYAEFQLLRNGSVVPWPAGTTATAPNTSTPKHNDNNPMHAIDGSLGNRFLTGPLQALTSDTKSSVKFDAYRIYESPVNSADYGRCPKSWIVSGSDDGVNWITLNIQQLVPTPDFQSGTGALVGTFSLSSDTKDWLPEEFRAATPTSNFNLSALTTSKLAFQVLAPRKEYNTLDNNGSGYSLTALTLLRDGAVVPWPDGTIAWTPAPGWNTAIGDPANLVNNDEKASNDNRFYSSLTLNHIVIKTPTPVTFDAYRWVTAVNVSGRDPISWRLMVVPSNNDKYHYLVDEQISYNPPTARGAVVGPFPIMQPAGLNAVDVIPDTSKVVINSTATLELGMETIETIGPLTGSGTLLLQADSTLGINLLEDALFEGNITGSGTLQLLGDHTQYFDTTTTGDLTVDFLGGKFGGTLHVDGELQITGNVAYPLPETLPASITLFTFDSITTDSRTALIAGADTIQPPPGMQAKVLITNSTATLTISSPGTLIILR